MKRILHPDSNCLDIGCHEGEVLRQIIKHAPKGIHTAFEPIPHLYEALKLEFTPSVTVLPYALAAHNGKSSFHLVKNALAYSGIKRRSYAVSDPDVEKITVETKTLDELIPADYCIDFIKIDVEGGEFDVLKGAEIVLTRCKPIVVFECGLGASEFYNTNPADLYRFLVNTHGMKVSTLQGFLNHNPTLSLERFEKHYNDKTEYYFIAHP
jgi:FkbM family methyltransferase